MSYSHTVIGPVGTDGVQRDVNGDTVASGLDEDTKAQLREMLEGPKVRVLPSDHDILVAAASGTGVVSDGQKYVNPNDSEDARAIAFRPGYDVTSADSTGQPESVVAEPSIGSTPSEDKAAEFNAKEVEDAKSIQPETTESTATTEYQ